MMDVVLHLPPIRTDGRTSIPAIHAIDMGLVLGVLRWRIVAITDMELWSVEMAQTGCPKSEIFSAEWEEYQLTIEFKGIEIEYAHTARP